MKTSFIRLSQLLGLALVAAGLGCSSSPALGITVFTAAPANIEAGGSTTLIFAATGSSKLTLAIDNGVGDVTGQTQTTVSPTATTTYTLTATDGSKNVTATTTVTVGTVSACSVSGLPATTPAGGVLGARVTVKDGQGNVDTAYTGTMTVTSSDTAAVLPSPTAFGTADRGIRVLPVTLKTVGSQTLTFADATNHLSCNATVAVTASSAIIAVTLPKDANAGNAATGTVAVVDAFANPIAAYAGTIHFTSTDAAASVPADIVFNGSQNGQANISVTFNTLGSQSITATDASGSAPGTAIVQVHGFVYTNPPATTGKLQLVLNPTASSTSVVQLDLVSNTSLTPLVGGNGARGGAFAVGMNLPVDVTKAVADATPIAVGDITDGGVLSLGLPPVAVGGSLKATGPTAGVFYTAVSQKAAGDGGVTGDQALATGQIFYSIRLKLLATAVPGTVFDGNNLGSQFRAAVRSISGTDVIQQPDFAIGLLQVQ